MVRDTMGQSVPEVQAPSDTSNVKKALEKRASKSKAVAAFQCSSLKSPFSSELEEREYSKALNFNFEFFFFNFA